MRRLFGWTAGILSVAALARLLGRRRRHQASDERPPDPADELRQRLAETRDAGEAATETPDVTHADEPTAPTEPLATRRARVHAKAQEAIDSMHEDTRS